MSIAASIGAAPPGAGSARGRRLAEAEARPRVEDGVRVPAMVGKVLRRTPCRYEAGRSRVEDGVRVRVGLRLVEPALWLESQRLLREAMQTCEAVQARLRLLARDPSILWTALTFHNRSSRPIAYGEYTTAMPAGTCNDIPTQMHRCATATRVRSCNARGCRRAAYPRVRQT